MINTYHTSMPLPPLPPPPPVPPRMAGHSSRPAARKSHHHHHSTLLWLVSVVLVLHVLLSCVGFIYLFDRGHQASLQQGEFHEKYFDDFLILKRLKKCDDNMLDDQSLLDCKQLLDTFRNVMAKASQTEGRVAMLTADQFHGALAHMEVSNTHGKTCKGGQDKNTCALEWNDYHSTRAHVETVGDSRLTIQHPGYYYIYSQVTFSSGNDKEVLRNSIRRIQKKERINKYTPPEEKDEEILVSSYCSLKTMPGLCTASTGGVFKLEKDEELYVSVNNLTWVNYDSKATFFGLYKL